eukprot:827272_1
MSGCELGFSKKTKNYTSLQTIPPYYVMKLALLLLPLFGVINVQSCSNIALDQCTCTGSDSTNCDALSLDLTIATVDFGSLDYVCSSTDATEGYCTVSCADITIGGPSPIPTQSIDGATICSTLETSASLLPGSLECDATTTKCLGDVSGPACTPATYGTGCGCTASDTSNCDDLANSAQFAGLAAAGLNIACSSEDETEGICTADCGSSITMGDIVLDSSAICSEMDDIVSVASTCGPSSSKCIPDSLGGCALDFSDPLGSILGCDCIADATSCEVLNEQFSEFLPSAANGEAIVCDTDIGLCTLSCVGGDCDVLNGIAADLEATCANATTIDAADDYCELALVAPDCSTQALFTDNCQCDGLDPSACQNVIDESVLLQFTGLEFTCTSSSAVPGFCSADCTPQDIGNVAMDGGEICAQQSALLGLPEGSLQCQNASSMCVIAPDVNEYTPGCINIGTDDLLGNFLGSLEKCTCDATNEENCQFLRDNYEMVFSFAGISTSESTWIQCDTSLGYCSLSCSEEETCAMFSDVLPNTDLVCSDTQFCELAEASSSPSLQPSEQPSEQPTEQPTVTIITTEEASIEITQDARGVRGRNYFGAIAVVMGVLSFFY